MALGMEPLIELEVPQHTLVAIVVSYGVLIHIRHRVRFIASLELENWFVLFGGEVDRQSLPVDTRIRLGLCFEPRSLCAGW